jgi:regulator of sirC expression with transglutaminase-like and TPR domain
MNWTAGQSAQEEISQLLSQDAQLEKLLELFWRMGLSDTRRVSSF